jgi:protein-S-isoprenylcysteine O-methyltransferase Ste14
MGWAIVEPGDRARSKALAEEATAAVVVVLGVVPAFVIAAIIEGFVTGTSVPHVLQLAIGIVVVTAYWCFLFGWWPGRRRVSRPPARTAQSVPADLIAR